VTAPGSPTPPIAFGTDAAAVTARGAAAAVTVPEDVVARLRDACAVVTVDAAERAEASRDWWPLAMVWALDDQVAGLASVVCRPTSADEVAAVLAVCNDARVPVTAAGGRSGVLGNAVPIFGGVVLDLCGLAGIVDVDATSMVVDVAAGTFGDALEEELRRDHGLTVGHWPQSMSLATVGGWIACRGAGQLSTRYGKIEDIVVGLDVVLADGRRIRTGGYPRSATGPGLDQLFLGSEGTLGVVTSARLRAHPAPSADRRTAWAFGSFETALDAMRRVLQRGATPAVLRLYDGVESARSYGTDGETCVLLALDEGDPVLIEAMVGVVEAECAAGGADRLDDALVEKWLGHRNDVAALEQLISGGLVVDTMEISAPWSALPGIYRATLEAIGGVDGTLSISAHQSHSYTDGGCLYFTFAGKVAPEGRTAYHHAVWDAGVRAVLAHGGSLSHHHGVGLHRGPYLRDALGDAFDVLVALKGALDPHGILNPGKLGLPSPFGPLPDLDGGRTSTP
jgi:alkyldihydroxyacetonephosphate synthase